MTTRITATELKKRIAAVRRSERSKRQELSRKLASNTRYLKALEEDHARVTKELAREKAMWSTRKDGVPEWEMGDAPADPRALQAHAGEVLDAILRDRDRMRESPGPAKERFESVLGRLKAGGARSAARRQVNARRQGC